MGYNANMARTGTRASAIIIKNNQVLLMHRKKEGKEYWTFPGGGIEEGETGGEAVVREVKEETGLVCTKVAKAFEVETFEGGNLHPYYFCEVEDGQPKLGGPEAERNSPDNWYQVEWVSLGDVEKINLLPETAKNKFLEVRHDN